MKSSYTYITSACERVGIRVLDRRREHDSQKEVSAESVHIPSSFRITHLGVRWVNCYYEFFGWFPFYPIFFHSFLGCILSFFWNLRPSFGFWFFLESLVSVFYKAEYLFLRTCTALNIPSATTYSTVHRLNLYIFNSNNNVNRWTIPIAYTSFSFTHIPLYMASTTKETDSVWKHLRNGVGKRPDENLKCHTEYLTGY